MLSLHDVTHVYPNGRRSDNFYIDRNSADNLLPVR